MRRGIQALGLLAGVLLALPGCAEHSTQTTGPKAAGAGRPSDDQIAFVARDSNIFAMGAGGGSPRRITSGPGFDSRPDWSPDRRRLAFVRSGSPYGPGHVIVMNADGTGLAPVTNGDPHFWDARWSPDGDRIAVSAEDVGGIRLHVMDADGSGLRRLVDIQSASPSWSPDGRFIAFEGSLEDREPDAIHRVDVRTGQTSLVVAAPQTLNQAPAWSPDGRRIAFIRIRVRTEDEQTITTGTDLFVVEAGGTSLRRLALDVSVAPPTWSPDGRQVGFASDGKLFVVDADGGAIHPLGDPTIRGSDPDWA